MKASDTKVCSTCKQRKPLDAFHKSKKGTHGRQGNCIECNTKQASEANWKKSGLSLDWAGYERLLASQGGRCAICQRTPKETEQKDRVLAVDHIHGSSVIRGLLCMDCNTALGELGDDPVRMRKAAEYVENAAKTVANC